MHAQLKTILQRLMVYHPLQYAYRSTLNFFTRKYYVLKYSRVIEGGCYCNFCQRRYSKFVDDQPSNEFLQALVEHEVIAGYGENVYCPHCWSSSRERLLLAFFNQIPFDKNVNVLHIAPEKHLYKYLSSQYNVTTGDLAPGFYQYIDKNVQRIDLMRLEFDDECFDVLIANHVLEHIPEDEVAMREIYRVVKKGGCAILQVPYSMKLSVTLEDKQINNPNEQARLFGQDDHVRIYALNDYVSRLSSVGWKVELIEQSQLDVKEDLCLQHGEVVVKVTKPLF